MHLLITTISPIFTTLYLQILLPIKEMDMFCLMYKDNGCARGGRAWVGGGGSGLVGKACKTIKLVEELARSWLKSMCFKHLVILRRNSKWQSFLSKSEQQNS